MSKFYNKVLALGHRHIETILIGNNHAEEKVDGSTYNFGIDKDLKLWVRSHSAVIHPEYITTMFKEATEYVVSIQDKLIPGYMYHGEMLNKPKHNVLSYSRIPTNYTIIFDIEDENGNPFDYETKSRMAAELGFETVQLLARNISTKEQVIELLNTRPLLGGEEYVEGIVIKNYDKLTPSGSYMVGKFVSERFKERHGKEWKGGRPQKKETIARLIEELRTEARWNKAIQHLREADEIEDEPRDIGKIIKEVIKDIEEEEADYIKEELYKEYIKSIKSGVTVGIPEWYKKKLLDNLK